MARWQDVVDSDPAFAAEVQEVLDAHKHKTIATLRHDGSPRLSGIEVEFIEGDVTFGMMPRSRKLADLRRDPRTEIHSASLLAEGEELSLVKSADQLQFVATMMPDDEKVSKPLPAWEDLEEDA